ncbi:E3 ubiquitin-protein ligase RNF8-like [Centruroides sculpturatus]|uniref:E3 ubiquitin-protein ligase RNF8-like n=1 Tax=Centruroides sculpturatus TaxID=218467 RepID=UPI000C6E220F|nr:E3 ubiquitin-protein ligase RNF8-like [Centruroides sculpturatus]
MLFCLEDLKKRKTIPLTDSEVLIGRSNIATVQIISTLVSRIHAKLKLEENQWQIQDTKSVNGIYINEKRLKSEAVQILNIGDIICLGPPNKSEFKFRFSEFISLNDSSDYGSPCKKRSKQSFQDNLTKNKRDKKENSEKKITDCGRIPVQSDVNTENKNCVKLKIKSAKTQFKDSKENAMVIKEIADKVKNNEDLLIRNVNKSENIELVSNDVTKLETTVITEPRNTEHLKLAIDNLKSMLEEKEKIQEELQRKLLLAEAQLKENKKENTDNLTKNKRDKKENSEKKITDCGRIPVQSDVNTENKNCVKLKIKSAKTQFKDSKENAMVIKEIADKVKNNEDLLIRNVNKSENIELVSNDVTKLETTVITEPRNTEHLKLAIDNLKSMLEEKEKIQEELQRKLLLAEAQLKENKKENTVKENNDNNQEENCSKEEKPNPLDHVNDIMESELICSICTELFIEAITLNCSHSFCKMCIQLWKKNKKKQVCPVCRTSIKTETPALTINNIIDKMVENLDSEMKEKRKQLIDERLSIAGCSKDNRNNKSVVIISDTESEISNSDDDENSYYSDTECSSSSTNDDYFDGCFSCGRRSHDTIMCPYKHGYSLRNYRY